MAGSPRPLCCRDKVGGPAARGQAMRFGDAVGVSNRRRAGLTDIISY
jgi:hypothetical protein